MILTAFWLNQYRKWTFCEVLKKNAQFSLSQRRKFYLLMNLLSWNLLYHLSHGRRFCLFSGYLLELLDFQIKIDCCYYFPLALIKSRSWHSNLRDTISGMTFNNLILIVVNVSIAQSQFSSQNDWHKFFKWKINCDLPQMSEKRHGDDETIQRLVGNSIPVH